MRKFRMRCAITVFARLLQLVSGVSYTGSAAPGTAEYFDLVSHSGGAATNLTVTPLSGTPILYASCGTAMAFPSAAVHMWTLPLQGSSGATLHITGDVHLCDVILSHRSRTSPYC
jgi:hypothetical protein